MEDCVMDKFNAIFTNIADAFKGENGPAYAGIIGIVFVVFGRYGYKLKTSVTNSEISLEPRTYIDVEDEDTRNYPPEIDASHETDNATT